MARGERRVMGGSRRVLVAWCPDWPVVALGMPPEVPVAVTSGNQVMACSAAARREGVRIGLRRREAQSRCPGLVVRARDPVQEARAFEPVVAAIATLVPAIEVSRPGLCALDVRRAERYFGGEPALCQRVAEVASSALPFPMEVGVGIAEGLFAATLAARRKAIVPREATASFLAPYPLSVLRRPALAELLSRLGIHTLGAFAALPAASVLARFGPDAAAAHRLARGLDDELVRFTPPPEKFSTAIELDPAVDRVDRVVAVGKMAAEELLSRLDQQRLVCTQLCIELRSEHAEHRERRWRVRDRFCVEGIVERLRWQLHGWAPSGGIVFLRLEASEVAPAGGRQLAFGDAEHAATDVDHRAARGVGRLFALLGPGKVFTGALRGGRAPLQRAVLVPWGEDHEGEPDACPWPGRHPVPAPALVYPDPLPAQMRGPAGEAVGVSSRGRLTASPSTVSIAGGSPAAIVAWAGPWLSDERWWDPPSRRRRAWFQVMIDGGSAHLCFLEGDRWWVEATYD